MKFNKVVVDNIKSKMKKTGKNEELKKLISSVLNSRNKIHKVARKSKKVKKSRKTSKRKMGKKKTQKWIRL
jgi:hypothetical protein